MPIKLGLIAPDGRNYAGQVFELSKSADSLIIENVDQRPVLSVLKDFSACVNLHTDLPAKDSVFQMAHDENLFNRWEAGQCLVRGLLVSLAGAIQSGQLRMHVARRWSAPIPICNPTAGLVRTPPLPENALCAMRRWPFWQAKAGMKQKCKPKHNLKWPRI